MIIIANLWASSLSIFVCMMD